MGFKHDRDNDSKRGPLTPTPTNELTAAICTPSPAPNTAFAARALPASRHGSEDVLALASSVCDYNIQLISHVETLRTRILELEDENARLRSQEMSSPSVGVEKMVDMLQADIAGLQRELELLKVAKRATDADLDGERRKNEMLTEMLACVQGEAR